MSELKAIRSGEIYNKIEYEDCYRTDDLYYPKSEVDAAIAELKDENRRLRRALWLARHERAMAESYSVLNDVPTSNRWIKALNKLNAKAKEYK